MKLIHVNATELSHSQQATHLILQVQRHLILLCKACSTIFPSTISGYEHRSLHCFVYTDTISLASTAYSICCAMRFKLVRLCSRMHVCSQTRMIQFSCGNTSDSKGSASQTFCHCLRLIHRGGRRSKSQQKVCWRRCIEWWEGECCFLTDARACSWTLRLPSI